MFHPVGSQPPAVYWRRRLLMLASAVLLLVLLILTVRTLFAGSADGAAADGGPNAAGPGPVAGAGSGATSDSPGGSPSAQDHPAASQSARTTATRSATGTAGTAGAATATGSPTKSAAPPAKCTAAQLDVRAVVGKPAYAVGDQPVLTLQVTNTAQEPCVQDVADSQIVLRVYNGASRVWGSHDCKIEPGVDLRTLEPGQPAGFSIVWSGLTSQPKCAGTRQRVGAGTYTLYASLSGHEGKATQFVIS